MQWDIKTGKRKRLYLSNHCTLLLAVGLNVFLMFTCSRTKTVSNNSVKLRSQYASMSILDVRKMVLQMNFFDKYWNDSGGFENRFELTNKHNNVVIDHATNLIWHQSGSEDFMNVSEAAEWIKILNQNEYAGINTWRLPTLEEALSLLENTKMNKNLYIDPIFDNWQWCILTGDRLTNNQNWLVAFSGRIDWFDSNVRVNYVRPVSSMVIN